jgi:hypothetical protein
VVFFIFLHNYRHMNNFERNHLRPAIVVNRLHISAPGLARREFAQVGTLARGARTDETETNGEGFP